MLDNLGTNTVLPDWPTTLEALQKTMLAFARMAEDAKVCPVYDDPSKYVPYKTWVVFDERTSTHATATLLQLECWKKGVMPSLLHNFDQWWIAQMLRRGFIKKVYGIRDDMFDPTQMEISRVQWESKSPKSSLGVTYMDVPLNQSRPTR
jgi:hypothetical protein